MQILVNGALRRVRSDPDTPLLWVLREEFGLTGTKFGCGVAQCGACTVHIDGAAALSCQVPVGTLEGADVTTIEGLAAARPRIGSDADDGAGHALHPVQQAWIETQVAQCGYCQSGQIMLSLIHI